MCVIFKPRINFVLCSASLIRGNRNNCTQFSRNLDWLVSKLERLESSSGIIGNLNPYSTTVWTFYYTFVLIINILSDLLGILEVLHCILVESPEALNIIQRGHIKSIISLLYKHGRNHKVRPCLYCT